MGGGEKAMSGVCFADVANAEVSASFSEGIAVWDFLENMVARI